MVLVECDPGYIVYPGDGGLCVPCPDGSYAVNQTICESCGPNMHTSGRPGTSVGDCSKYFFSFSLEIRISI